MITLPEIAGELSRIDDLTVTLDEPLAQHTRFGIGGPASIFADTENEGAFAAALSALHRSSIAWTVIGGGTNLVVSDAGYRGVVLRFRGSSIGLNNERVEVQSGATLQQLVDFSIAHGLEGLDRMTGIPGFVGAAIYGNAGAYGQSISDTLESVRLYDGERVREFTAEQCEFRYRHSIFKCRKDWLILSAVFHPQPGDGAVLKASSDEILATRNRKYPPEMRCAGSIFKNLLLNELPPMARDAVPESVVKKGKVPAAWFLDQTGARGLRRGGIVVADYHANLIYNDGGGTAAQLKDVIAELKRRVGEQFGLRLEEEVQFLGE
jgi:UDP-N-acetylmuramate dehydrogenase